MSPLLLAIEAMGQGVRRVFVLISPATGEVLTWTVSRPHARRLADETHPENPRPVVCCLEVGA